MEVESVASVGSIEIVRVREHEHVRDPDVFFDDAQEVRRIIDREIWLSDWCDEGMLRLTFQAFLLKTVDSVILVDPCIGNDRKFFIPGTPFHTDFLDQLRDAVGDLNLIETVAYTHLHLDHIGWSTTLVEGQWIPTFPWARHVIIGEEWENWEAGHDPYTDLDRAIDFAIRPLFEAGLVDLVDHGCSIAPGVQFRATSGHTRGHASMDLYSDGQHALITGDAIHHPVQVYEPRWTNRGTMTSDEVLR